MSEVERFARQLAKDDVANGLILPDLVEQWTQKYVRWLLDFSPPWMPAAS